LHVKVQMPVRRLLCRSFLLGFLLFLASCSGRRAVYPVSGKVFFEGYPCKGARVQFFPKEQAETNPIAPSGLVGDDGSFKLTTYVFGDGAPAGSYSVTVFWGVPSKGGDGYDRILVPERYLNSETSGLTVEVGEKATELPPFQLSR
jgi:hypothetical protein